MHRVPRTLDRSSRVAAVIALAALTLVVPAGRAQTPAADTEAEAHPVHIHSGTCDQLGDVVYPLADVTYPTGEEMGAAGGHEVKISEGNHIDAPLQDLLDMGVPDEAAAVFAVARFQPVMQAARGFVELLQDVRRVPLSAGFASFARRE